MDRAAPLAPPKRDDASTSTVGSSSITGPNTYARPQQGPGGQK